MHHVIIKNTFQPELAVVPIHGPFEVDTLSVFPHFDMKEEFPEPCTATAVWCARLPLAAVKALSKHFCRPLSRGGLNDM